MIVYLLFIFTCGWCVCWLLFLNYQQHALDGHRRRHPSQRRSRSRSRKRLGRGDQMALGETSGDLEAGSGRVECETVLTGARQRPATRVSRRSRAEAEELEGEELEDDYDIECADDADGQCLECACERAERRTGGLGLESDELEHLGLFGPSGELRGWPEIGAAESEPASDADDGDGDQSDGLWPIVELHENPLGVQDGLGEADQVNRSPEVEANGPEQLRRSRLLSLQAGQSEFRAAIRLVSLSSAAHLNFSHSPPARDVTLPALPSGNVRARCEGPSGLGRGQFTSGSSATILATISMSSFNSPAP